MFTYKGCSFELSEDASLCRQHHHKCTIILMSLDYFTLIDQQQLEKKKRYIWCNFYTGCFCILWDVVRYDSVSIYHLFPWSQIPDLSVQQPSILQRLSTKPIDTLNLQTNVDNLFAGNSLEANRQSQAVTWRKLNSAVQAFESGTWFSFFFIEPLYSCHNP